MESVKDKVVLITGASSGIGAATAVEFAKYGSRLVLTGRNVDNLNKTAEQCQAQGLDKDKLIIIAGDVSVDEDLTRIVDTAVSKFSTIHILINNAAILEPSDDLQSPSVDALDTTYRVNLRAPILLTKLVIPHLKINKGSVVNVSSNASVVPGPFFASYGMMKAALDMFTKDLALELAKDGVRVNSCNPGSVRTSIHEGFGFQGDALEQHFKNFSELHPIGRLGLSEEIARSIVFLASDASSFTTGAILMADGGLACTAAWTPRTITEQEK